MTASYSEVNVPLLLKNISDLEVKVNNLHEEKADVEAHLNEMYSVLDRVSLERNRLETEVKFLSEEKRQLSLGKPLSEQHAANLAAHDTMLRSELSSVKAERANLYDKLLNTEKKSAELNETARKHVAAYYELLAENTALKKAFAEADIVAEYERKDGRRDWWSGGYWLHTGEMLVCIDRSAFDTIQRKEAQP